MENAFRSPWMGLALPVLVTGLCLWLAYNMVATGVAGYYENDGDGAAALHWRASSPTALSLEAERMVDRGDRDAGDAMARRALLRSSLRADALEALALSASAEGRPDKALSLMSRAGRLNPRDSRAQGWLLERAMARSDYRRAVLHADSLMRRSSETWSPLSFMLAARLEDRVARTALVQRLSVGPPWRGTFLTIAARNGAEADVAALLQALNRTAAPATDGEAAPFFNRLVAEAKYSQAKEYFDAFVRLRAHSTPLVYDGGFAGLRGPPPLNWQAISGAGGSARWSLDNGAPSGSLRVSHDGFSSSDPLVRQLIIISPGSYQVAARARIDAPTAAGRFKLQISCVSGSILASMPLHGAPESWAPSRAVFTVPPEACEAQWLQIVPVTGDRREVAEMSIDDIVVRRAAAGVPPSQQMDRRR